MAVKRPRTNAVAKTGVLFVQNAVEKANCIFHPIHTENDVGIDAIIEFVENEKATGKSIAAQIKSGQSYFRKGYAVIPATRDQLEYWLHHPLTVIGIVCDVDENVAYWVDIKKYIQKNRSVLSRNTHNIRVCKTDVYEFTYSSFVKIFSPLFMKKPLELSFDEARDWSYSDDFEKHALGIGTLFYQYAGNMNSWDIFFDLLANRDAERLDPYIAYILAHIPGHPDIFWWIDRGVTDDLREKLLKRVNKLTIEDLRKLLLLVDDENGFQRGTIGQNVDALINAVDSKNQLLKEIIDKSDARNDSDLIERACILYAYYVGIEALPFLKSISAKYEFQLDLLEQIVQELEVNECVYLY